VYEYATVTVYLLNELLFIDMLLMVIQAGTQNADVNKQLANNELEVIVDSARLFDRCVLGLGRVLEYLVPKQCH